MPVLALKFKVVNHRFRSESFFAKGDQIVSRLR